MSILNDSLNEILQNFADKLWVTMVDLNVNKSVKDVYFEGVNKLLNSPIPKMLDKPTLNNLEKTILNNPTKPSIPLPFYGHVNNGRCCGIKKNHRLYTQCSRTISVGDYCKICMKQAKNNASGKPNCGDIGERVKQWNDGLDYQPNGMKREVPYANIMAKLNIDIEHAQLEVKKLGWSPIPLCHLIEKKVRRGRPKQLVDSDEETTTRPRGRPRKIKAPDLTNEELVAQYLGQAY